MQGVQARSAPFRDRSDGRGVSSRSRVTVLGDACHPMTCFKGQGANQALADAAISAAMASRRNDVPKARRVAARGAAGRSHGRVAMIGGCSASPSALDGGAPPHARVDDSAARAAAKGGASRRRAVLRVARRWRPAAATIGARPPSPPPSLDCIPASIDRRPPSSRRSSRSDGASSTRGPRHHNLTLKPRRRYNTATQRVRTRPGPAAAGSAREGLRRRRQTRRSTRRAAPPSGDPRKARPVAFLPRENERRARAERVRGSRSPVDAAGEALFEPHAPAQTRPHWC